MLRKSNRLTKYERERLCQKLHMPLRQAQTYMEKLFIGDALHACVLSLQPREVQRLYQHLDKPALWFNDPSTTIFWVGDVRVELFQQNLLALQNCESYVRMDESLRSEFVARVSDTHPWREEIQQWVDDYLRLAMRCARAYVFLDFMEHYANTPGQWFRIWPQVVPLLNGPMQRVIADQSKRSRFPVTWDYYAERFPPDVIQDITDVIAESKLGFDTPDMSMLEVLNRRGRMTAIKKETPVPTDASDS